MYDILSFYLENGLRVVMHKISGIKTMTCGIWINQGSKYENDENNGLTHIVEHMLFSKDNYYNSELVNYFNEISNNGINYNAATTKEHTYYYFGGLADNLELCLNTIASIVMNNKSFPEDLFENEKKVIEREAISFYSSFNQIKERTGQALFGNNDVGRIIIGTIDNIRNSTINQVNEIIETTYTPENSTLIVIGDIDYDKTLYLIGQKFYKWSDMTTRKYEELIESEPGIYYHDVNSDKSSIISIGFKISSINDSNRITSEIIASIMSDPIISNRIPYEVRIKRGLAYNIGGFVSSYEKRGIIGFTVVCNNENLLEVSKIMMNEIRRAKKDKFSEEEIEKAKKSIKTKRLFDITDINNQLSFLGKFSSYGKIYSLENEIRSIEKCSPNDINDDVNNIFMDENLGLAIIGKCEIDNLITEFKVN